MATEMDVEPLNAVCLSAMAKNTTRAPANSSKLRSSTSYDVARLAGVSQSAVSRCFESGASISDKTRQKVLAAATELNYAPNAIARSLAMRRSNIVAVLVTETSARHTPDILMQLNVELMRCGLHLLLFSITQETGPGDVIANVLRHQVDGVIACTTLPQEQILRCNQLRIPVVVYNRVAAGGNACSVGCDHVNATRDIADRLYRSGHRHFAFIAGGAAAPVSIQRQIGLVGRLQELGVADVAIAMGDFGYESGRDCMLSLGDSGRPLTAVVCANDVMAFGAMDAARFDRGKSVPDDFSVIGFDDVSSACRPPYQLTTVRQPTQELARQCVQLLIERIENKELPPHVILLPGELIVRKSARIEPA
jgi:DNA-binding LacI/PurR family transcriptional regulator